MNNTLAIATVTSTMRHVLDESLGGPEPGAVGGAEVTTLGPHRLLSRNATHESPAGLDVYLYQVSPSRTQNLGGVPTPASDRLAGLHPFAALDLHYLVTAYGDDTALEPQRLLARAVRALAATPVFTTPIIAAAVAKYGHGDTAFLANSDLSEQPEPIRVVPAPLSIGEASDLWRALATPYLLSLGYTATVVLL